MRWQSIPSSLSVLCASGEWCCVVTSRHQNQIHGMTVSSFCSVSADPPLVLVCGAEESNTQRLIQQSGIFAVNILPRGAAALASRFADQEQEATRFKDLATCEASTGAPLLLDSRVSFDCRVTSQQAAGDHVIFVGEVESLRLEGQDPLLYYDGQYRRLASPSQ